MKTIIFNSLRQQPTATNEKSLSFNWNIFLPKSFIVDRANKFLSSGNSIFFYFDSFSAGGNDVEAVFPYVETYFINKFFIPLTETDFLFSGKTVE